MSKIVQADFSGIQAQQDDDDAALAEVVDAPFRVIEELERRGVSSETEAILMVAPVLAAVSSSAAKLSNFGCGFNSYFDGIIYGDLIGLLLKALYSLSAELKNRKLSVSSEIVEATINAVRALKLSCRKIDSAANTEVTKKFTYIISCKSSGLLKIGRTNSVSARLSALQCGSPGDLDVVHVFDGDIENRLHKKFASIRVRGEWFRDDGAIRAFVAKQETHTKAAHRS